MKKIFPVFLFFSLSLQAQEKKNIELVRSGDSLKPFARDTAYIAQKDLYDIAKSIFGKKNAAQKNAAKKSDTAFVKPVISVIPAVGYTLTSRLAVTLSGNMAFRASPNSKASTITASTAYTQNKQFTAPI